MIRKRLITRQYSSHVRRHLLIPPAFPAALSGYRDLHISVALFVKLREVFEDGVGLPRVIGDAAAEGGGAGGAFAGAGLDGGFAGVVAGVRDIGPTGRGYGGLGGG